MVESIMGDTPHGWADGDLPDSPLLPLVGRDSLEICVKYASYIQRQEKQAQQIDKRKHFRIPDDYDFSICPNLSPEEVEKLSLHRPETIEDAQKISGITPNALLTLYQELG